jgi:hypothetical protein
MPRYYIHIRTPNGVDRDPIGIERRSLADARAFLSDAVTKYVNDGIDLNLELVATSSFEIANEEGRRELILPFADILPEPEV